MYGKSEAKMLQMTSIWSFDKTVDLEYALRYHPSRRPLLKAEAATRLYEESFARHAGKPKEVAVVKQLEQFKILLGYFLINSCTITRQQKDTKPLTETVSWTGISSSVACNWLGPTLQREFSISEKNFGAKEKILKVYYLNFKNFDMIFLGAKRKFSKKNNPKLFIQKKLFRL